jgi:hypothetical protein
MTVAMKSLVDLGQSLGLNVRWWDEVFRSQLRPGQPRAPTPHGNSGSIQGQNLAVKNGFPSMGAFRLCERNRMTKARAIARDEFTGTIVITASERKPFTSARRHTQAVEGASHGRAALAGMNAGF